MTWIYGAARLRQNAVPHLLVKAVHALKAALKWLMIFLLWPHLAAAEWLPVSSSPERTIYIDNQRILGAGTSVRAWVMTDYGQGIMARNTAAYSELALWEINCPEQTATMRQVTSFEEPMAKGRSIETTRGTGEWQVIAPNSVGYGVLTVACANTPAQK